MLGGGISTPLSIYSSQTCRRIHKALTSASFAFFAAGRMQIYPSIHLSVKQPIYSYIDVPIYLFIPILPTNTQSPHQCLLRLLCRWQNADLSIHPSICQTAHLFIHRRPYLSIHPNLSDEYTKPSPVPPSPSLPLVECRSIHPSIYLSNSPSIHTSTPLSIYSSQSFRRIHKALTSASFAFFAAGRMQIYPSIHLSVKQPIYSYIDAPIYLFIPIFPTNTQSPHQCLLRLLCRW